MATLASPLQALLQGRGRARGPRDGGKPGRAVRECCTMTEPSTEDEAEAEARLLEEDGFDDDDLLSLEGDGSGRPEEDGPYASGGLVGGGASSEESDGLPSDEDEGEDHDDGAGGPWGSQQAQQSAHPQQQQRARVAGGLARRLQQERRRQKTYRRPRERCGEPMAGTGGQGAAQGGRSVPLPYMTLEQLEQLETAQAAYRAANSATATATATAVTRRQAQPTVFAASLVTDPLSSTPFWALQPCYSYPPSHQQHQQHQQQSHAGMYQAYQQQYHPHQHQHAPLPPGLAYHPLQQQQQLQGGLLVRQPAFMGQEPHMGHPLELEEDDDPVTFHELLGWDEAPPPAPQRQRQQHMPQFDSIGGCSASGGFPFPIAVEEEAAPLQHQHHHGHGHAQQMLAADPEELRAAEEAAMGAARREEARQRAAAAVAAIAGQAPQPYHHHQHAQQEQQMANPPRPQEAGAGAAAEAGQPEEPLGQEAWDVGPRYRVVRLLGHGSYGEVAEAWDTVSQRRVAVKRIRNAFENVTDARRIYREMYILRQLRSHPNMVTLLDVVPPKDYSSFVDLYLVFEYVDTDLYKLILSPQQLTNDHIETFVYQLLLSLKYLQSAHVIHRDLKPANILLNEDCSLKLCDFGLARVVNQQRIRGQHGARGSGDFAGDALSPITEGRSVSPPPAPGMGMGGQGQAFAFGVGNPPPPAPRLVRRQMSEMARLEEQQAIAASTAALGPPPRLTRQLTKHVVTRWYRAPELILLQDYTQAVDVWSLGCIFAELLSMQAESVPNHRERAPLFPGKSCFPLSVDQARPSCADKLDQLNVIFDVIGTPSEEDLEGLGPVKRYFQTLAPRKPRPLTEFYPGAHADALDLLSRMLRFNPDRRITVDEALAHPYLQHVRDPSLEVTLGTPLVDRGTSGLSLERVKRALYDEIRAFHGHVQLQAPPPPSPQPQPQPQQPAHPPVPAPAPSAEPAYTAAFYYQQQQQHQQHQQAPVAPPPRAEGYWSVGASQAAMQHQQHQQHQGFPAYHTQQQQQQGQELQQGRHAVPVPMMEC